MAKGSPYQIDRRHNNPGRPPLPKDDVEHIGPLLPQALYFSVTGRHYAAPHDEYAHMIRAELENLLSKHRTELNIKIEHAEHAKHVKELNRIAFYLFIADNPDLSIAELAEKYFPDSTNPRRYFGRMRVAIDTYKRRGMVIAYRDKNGVTRYRPFTIENDLWDEQANQIGDILSQVYGGKPRDHARAVSQIIALVSPPDPR